MAFQKLCTLDNLTEGQGREFLVGSRIVAVFRVGRQVFSLDGLCAHQGGPIAKGRLDGFCVTCPWHGWQYDVTNGTHLLSQKKLLESIPTEVRGDEVWIDLDGS